MLENLLTTRQFSSWEEIVLSLAVAFMLGYLISWVYRVTHRGVSYSQSYVHSLVILAMIIAIVMMVVGNNIARAFSLVGALSIIRFRTVIKDTRDTAFIFLSLAAGMACGAGSHGIAIVGTVLIGAVMGLLYMINFGKTHRGDFLLRFRMTPLGENAEDGYRDLFRRFLSSSMLINLTTCRQGQAMEFAFHVRLKDPDHQNELVRSLAQLGGVERVNLLFNEEGAEV
jgi:uncharacterized membrane protein YhiD involved in acid resistance